MDSLRRKSRRRINGPPLRRRLEARFESYGRALVGRRALVLAMVGVVTAGLAAQIPDLTFDTSNDAMLHPDDPHRVAYDEFRSEFGRDDVIMIAVQAPEIFSADCLDRLRAFHRDLDSSVPHVEEITSLWNARATRAEGALLRVGDLIERRPETQAAMDALRARVLENPLYVNSVVSADARLTAVTVRPTAHSAAGVEEALAGFDAEEPAGDGPRMLTGDELERLVAAVFEVMARHDGPDFRLRAAGTPVLLTALLHVMEVDLIRSIALAAATIGVLLSLIFRRPVAVALPLAVVLLSGSSTVGLMALTGVPVSFGTQILPSFLLAVGVGYAVHVLAIFFQRYDRGASREEAVALALGHSGVPILLTAVTTAGGLLSFSVADLYPLATLGVFAPVGVLLCFVYTVTLLPVLLMSVPVRRRVAPREIAGAERVLAGIGAFAVRNARAVLAAAAVVVTVSLLGVPRLELTHDPLAWFPASAEVQEATRLVDRELRGSIPLEVVIDTARENGLHDPELLAGIDAMGRHALQTDHGAVDVGKAISLVDVVKEVNRALHEDRPEFYAIPDDRKAVAQELLLFEQSGSDDLRELTDPVYSRARLTLRAGWTDALNYPRFLDALRAPFAELTDGRASFRFTGMLPVMSRVFAAVLQSMIKSYLLALAIITPLMILLIGNVRVGLASMAPNLAPIAVTLGLMGWVGIPIDAFTLLVGGIAIGLAVDDTIHFMHNFRRYYGETADAREAVRRTLRTAGRAIFFTSVVLIAGFLIFAVSPMWNLKYFGLLTAFTVGAAFLADVLISPALVSLLARPAEERR